MAAAPPTADEEVELARRIRDGDEAALAEMVDRNRPLAWRMARRLLWTGLPFDDLAQEGSIGLIEAARIFEPGPARFGTLACVRMRQVMLNAARGWRKGPRLSADPVEAVALDGGEPPDEAAARAEMAAEAEALLGRLSARDAAIVRMRFGLGPGGEARTLDEVARAFGMGRDAIGGRIERALRTMRRAARPGRAAETEEPAHARRPRDPLALAPPPGRPRRAGPREGGPGDRSECAH